MNTNPSHSLLKRIALKAPTPFAALRHWACLAILLMALGATQALAAPSFTPFLAVDINGYNAGGGQVMGPTATGYEGWEAAEGLLLPPSIDWSGGGAAGLTRVFSTSEGNITATMSGVGVSLGARNRGANGGALGELTQDFVFAQRDFGLGGLGRNYIELTLSGLSPGQQYEVTAFAREPAFSNSDSFQAWTDRAALGGLDGPSAWLDANIGAGASYLAAPGGVNNPIPTLVRAQESGPDSSDPYAYSASILSFADAGGVVTIYGWADGNDFDPDTQGASLLNGFQIAAVIPEPGTLTLVGAGLIGILIWRRRTC